MTKSSFVGYDGRSLPPPADRSVPPRETGLTSAATVPPPSRISPRETLDFQMRTNSGNKLLEAAMPLLGLSVRLREMTAFDGVEALHARLINEVQAFQREIEALDYDNATVLAARYALCAMIDESVLSQVWGAESLWPERPLLSIYHNETWGGEKFFSILDRVMNESHRFIDLLEFLYFCMVLGFEGKYHVMHNGQAKLDHLIEAVYRLLEKHRGEPPAQLLSPDPNIYDKGQSMARQFPLWGIALGGLALLVLIHIALDVSLTQRITAIATELGGSLDIAPAAQQTEAR